MKKVSLFILALVVVCKGLYAQVQIEPMITGGFPINITEAPWQVLLRVNGEDWCGGSIIAPNFILTAKHCLFDDRGILLQPSAIRVITGTTCRNQVNSSNTFNVSRIILHPDPNVDAALLQLSSHITFNNNRRAINYLGATNSSHYNVGNRVRVSGWGMTMPNVPVFPNCLQAVDVNIISNQAASDVLRPLPSWRRDLRAHEMATTGTGDIRQGACHADSGGPLSIRTSTNEPVLIGIVQGGVPGCGGSNQNSPSVFVRVSHIVTWIASHINPPAITGPAVICSGSSGTFHASNWQTGYRWEISNNLRLNGTNQSNSLSVLVNSNGAGWVRVMSGTMEIARHDVWVGVPDISLNSNRVDGPINLAVGQVGAYSVNHSPHVLPPHATIRWAATGQSASISSIGRFANISFGQVGSYQISAAVSNQCGSTFFATIDVNVFRGGGDLPPACNCNPSWGCSCLFFGLSVYPNPASDILNIELGTTTTTIPFRSDITSSDNIYDIRLYNDRGNLVRQMTTQGGAIQFDVSNLPTGVYSLHIHDGVSCSPDVRQIVIRR